MLLTKRMKAERLPCIMQRGREKEEIVELLVSEGTDLKKSSKAGHTALHFAATNGKAMGLVKFFSNKE